MREVRHAKRVSVIAGGATVLAASLGLWRAAVLGGFGSQSTRAP
ncbi:hypothetical protein PSET11_00903 [Arthrobacter ulcerisalmonis]|uniref:Uncharacterized protein n=1 Tax=Arthrobacter ulcerisalmonis TaxID=2483813 RepID=A0A3P5X4R5_9MICC|nr:hypothetical protein PSET11_00903 [Arthrobacter ulcerisalmonis]